MTNEGSLMVTGPETLPDMELNPMVTSAPVVPA